MDVLERIREQVEGNPIVLYMKGTPQFPMCGFSARAAAALQDGLSHGTLLMWDEFDLKWRAAEHTWSNGAATLEWNPGLSEWVAVEPLLDWLSNVDAAHRADMSALVNNDALFFDESSHRWVVRRRRCRTGCLTARC